MATAVSRARWLFNEASSGTTPTTVADATGNGNTLTIDYSSGDASWSNITAGNGLNITAIANTAVGPRLYIADASATGNIQTQLDGKTELSLLLVVDVNTPAADVTLFRLANQNSGSAAFAVGMDSSRHITLTWGAEYGSYSSAASSTTLGTGVRVIAIRIDTTQATAINREKISDNSTLMSIAGGSDLTQNSAFTVEPGYNLKLDIFNRGAGDNNPQGKVYYAELFTGLLTDQQITDSYNGLIASNDANWVVTAPTLSAGTPTGTVGASPTFTATTTSSTGTARIVVDSSANLSGVTATQVLAGQKASGAAAYKDSGNITVSSTTISTTAITGLADGTYTAAAVHNNGANSNVLTWTFTVSSVSPATKLVFTTQPANTVVGATMANVVVSATDAGNVVDTSYVTNVTIALQTGSGTLAGTLTRAAVAGVATFSGLSINTLNTGAVLRATSGSLTLADSSTFNITSGAGGGGLRNFLEMPFIR